MKKIISLLLLLAICISVFAGCKKDNNPDTDNQNPTNGTNVQSDLNSAIEYLTSMYKKSGKDEAITIAKDLDLLSKVVVGGVSYDVAWAVSITEGPSDSAKLGESSQENHVLLDINETPAAEVLFTATATVKDAAGKTAAVTFKYKIVASATAGMTPEEVVEMAYALAEGEVMEGAATLTANIAKLKTPYDANFGNITIVIAVPGLEDKPIECYRLTGEKVSNNLCVGDTVTVTGILKNYNGTIEFDAGSTLDNVVSCGIVKPTDPKLIVDEAFALAAGDSLKYFSTLSGVVKSIDSEYSDQYKNVSITIVVEGSNGSKDLVCYRMKGDDAANVAVGDTVTITGVIKNYVSSSSGESTVEFDAGCVLDQLVKGNGTVPGVDTEPVEKPDTEAGIVDAAYKLEEGKSLPYSATLTGKVTKIVDAYNSEFKNITVLIEVKGREKKPIECFRLTGDGVEKIAVGDTITVTGTLKNFYGKIEFDLGCKLDKRVSGGKDPIKQETDPKKIVDAAFKLKEDTDLGYDVTLTGKIVDLKTPYDSEFKNITVIIEVAGSNGMKEIECFRMKGDKVSNKLCVGDTITVKGRLKNYQGTVEFDTGCTMEKYTSCGIKVPTDSKKIVDAAFALKDGETLKYFATLTGKVTKVTDAYDSEYKNISVNIEVTGSNGAKSLKCYRLKGDGVDKVAEGDTITVTGRLKNYKGTVEFDAGCTLDKRVAGPNKPVEQETDSKKIVDEAFKLADGKDLGYDVSLTGKIVKLKTPYDSEFKNITVIIEVAGSSGMKEIECFRMKGDKVSNKLCVGDTITVKGRLKNYKGTIEFDANCTMEKYTSCGIKVPTDPKKIVDEAFALKGGDSLKYFVTLTGKVTKINTAYDSQYKNVTVTIEVEGSDGVKELKCYRLKGDGADKIKVGDTITVTGIIKNYVHSSSGESEIEFDAGCTLG